jgi:hypothetical protein
MGIRRRIEWAGPLWLAGLVACGVAGDPRGGRALRLENDSLTLVFDTADGGLVELTDRGSGERFVVRPHADAGIWRLDRDTVSAGIVPEQAGSFSWRALPDEGGHELEWRDFGLAEAPSLAVRARVRLLGSTAQSEWRIAVDSPGTLGIEQVRYPRVVGIPRLGPGEELAVPRWMGALARDPDVVLSGPDGAGRRQEWAYPGALSLQLLALYRRGGSGFYAAADDTLAYRKALAIWGEADGSRGFEMLHPVSDPGRQRERWEPAYAARIGTFRGDWMTAAERYREWGTQQAWARESRLRRGLVPQWLLETGMWVWNRGRSPGVVPPALALQEALGLPVRIFWHWWHGGPYDTSFPDYLPPREGVASFTAALEAAHEAGSRAIVYMNQRLWCTGTPSWGPAAAAAAVKERDGRVREEVYNIFDPQPCATMDVTTPYWRGKYAGIADTVLAGYGVDGIYMDQAVLSLVCWDPAHGHPVGGGNYWMDGFRALATQIRSESSKEVLLAGEGAGEPWLPELDLMLTLQVSQERYSDSNSGWDPIPFFQAVYHAYGVTYGSYSSLVMPPYDELWPKPFAPAEPLKLLDARFRRQFKLEQARSFAWGLQPTIANFRPSLLQDRPEETAFLMRLAHVRARALDHLLYGTFLRPPELDVPVIDVDLSRVSIYAAQRGGPTVSTAAYPAALAGAWRAADGSVGMALASVADEPIPVAFDFDPAAYGLAGPGAIERIGEEGSAPFGTFAAGPTRITLDMPAGAAYVLVFRQDRTP